MLRASWGSTLAAAVDRFRTAQARADTYAQQFTAETSMNVIADAMRNFEGSHPRGAPRVPNSAMKPNIVTGTLRRSTRGSGTTRVGRGRYRNTVGPTALYGRRVEMGFRGADSLGRTYNQPGYPFFGPAVKKNRVLAERRAGETFTWSRLLT